MSLIKSQWRKKDRKKLTGIIKLKKITASKLLYRGKPACLCEPESRCTGVYIRLRQFNLSTVEGQPLIANLHWKSQLYMLRKLISSVSDYSWCDREVQERGPMKFNRDSECAALRSQQYRSNRRIWKDKTQPSKWTSNHLNARYDAKIGSFLCYLC